MTSHEQEPGLLYAAALLVALVVIFIIAKPLLLGDSYARHLRRRRDRGRALRRP